MKGDNKNAEKRVVMGGREYVHTEDKEYDFMTEISVNKVKVVLKFSKDPRKNESAKKALESFFTGLS